MKHKKMDWNRTSEGLPRDERRVLLYSSIGDYEIGRLNRERTAWDTDTIPDVVLDYFPWWSELPLTPSGRQPYYD